MRVLLLAAALCVVAGVAEAQTRGYRTSPYGGGYGSPYGGGYGTGSNPNSHMGGGYTTPRGTYVEPYRATNPNGTQYDNYGTRGNQNPYTGNYGTWTPRY